MRNTFCSFLILLSSTFAGYCQKTAEIEALLTQGKMYEVIALLEYKKEKGKELNKQEHWFLARAYEETHQYPLAATAFERVFELDTLQSYPQALLKAGRMYKQSGEYQIARSIFDGAKRFFQQPCSLCLELEQEVKSTQWVIDQMENRPPLEPNNISLAINTDQSEFNGRYFDTLSFAFSRLTTQVVSKKKEIKVRKNQLFIAFWDGQKYREDSTFFSAINQLGQVANGAFSPDQKHVLFTHCPGNDCGIWIADIKGKALNPRPIAMLNKPGAQFTQPALHLVGTDTLLFFAAKLPQSNTGFDLYTSTFSNGRFSEPIALDKVNTQGDELAPFFSSTMGLLYFSSDWHRGFGGQDIFSIPFPDLDSNALANAGWGINSPSNDLYYNETPDGKTILFTSNRDGIITSKTSNCCNDLFTLPSPYILFKEVKEDNTIQQLIDSARNFLPISLYFHNDEPDPKTKQVTSSQPYSHWYKSYWALFEQYRGASPSNPKQIQSFFKQLDQEYAKLQSFLNVLELLQAEQVDIALKIKGHASPLALNNYNFYLTQRRIDSFRQEIGKRFGTGTSIPKNVHLFPEPYGEENAKSGISDNPKQPSLSIFSIEAMQERRIEILGINIEP